VDRLLGAVAVGRSAHESARDRIESFLSTLAALAGAAYSSVAHDHARSAARVYFSVARRPVVSGGFGFDADRRDQLSKQYGVCTGVLFVRAVRGRHSAHLRQSVRAAAGGTA